MARDIAFIRNNTLISVLSDGNEFRLASATKRFDGTFRWFGCSRSGRRNFSTPTDALLAAARALYWKIDTEQRVKKMNGRDHTVR